MRNVVQNTTVGKSCDVCVKRL